MKLIINAQEHIVDDGITLLQLVENLKIDTRKVAIERNLQIVPCSTYSQVKLEDSDKLEIVEFVGGG
ncbi:sulfur carrier protein ThiS [Rickettsiales bacterium]|nr:sulfur carrier protein ThiS [Rickettsiales bacterium]